MKINVLGYQTHRDKFAVDTNLNKLINRINDFADNSIVDSDLKRKYNINESNDWVLKNQRRLLKNEKKIIDYISLTSYRPFDNQYAILNKVICDRPRKEILQHILNKDNLCLLNSKQQAIEGFRHCFISKLPANDCVMSTTSREANQVFPLYLYPDNNAQQTIDQQQERTPNLNMEIVKEIAEKLGMVFVNEKVSSTSSETYMTGNSDNGSIGTRNETIEPRNGAIELVEIAPIDILDYIYAVLHSPTYREKYKEFLKIDFPRVPYPKDQDTFWKLVKLGGEIRQIHLLESSVVDKPISKYPITGTNIVGKPRFELQPVTEPVEVKGGNVFINETQYFEDVPEVAWNFYIGGYQPAQKWLKDRKERELQIDDIRHYLKIIVALTETDRLMKEIDSVCNEW